MKKQQTDNEIIIKIVIEYDKEMIFHVRTSSIIHLNSMLEFPLLIGELEKIKLKLLEEQEKQMVNPKQDDNKLYYG